jgi:hypothetical protein
MHLNNDTGVFHFTPQEALIVTAEQWPANGAVDLLKKLVTLRVSAEGADASHLSSPHARRQFEDERQVRIGEIDLLTDAVSLHVQDQLAQEATIFLRNGETGS